MLRHHKLNRRICDAEEREFERGWYMGLHTTSGAGTFICIN